MKKKLSLLMRAFFSLIHIAFVKILNISTVHISPVQDFALSTKLRSAGGGRLHLAGHIHARRNTLFEAEGGIIEVGEGCFFNSGCMIVSKESIKIGEYTCFGPNVLVYDHDHGTEAGVSIHDSGYKTSPVIIGKNVWIGANSVILRGSVIGEGSVIGAGSVIKGVYEPNSIVIQKRAEEITKKREARARTAVV